MKFWIVSRNFLNGLLAAAAISFVAPHAIASPGNSAVFLDDENDVGKARLGFLRGENSEVLITTFLFDGNRAGSIAFAELREAARRGAKVKVVIDGVQFGGWQERGLTPGLLRHLDDEGVEVRVFNPINLNDLFTYFSPSASSVRNHEKLMILTGSQVVDTGDRNMQNINFRLQNDSKMKGLSYRSVEVFTHGPVAKDAREHFYNDIWNSPWVHSLNLYRVSDDEILQGKRRLDAYMKVSLKIPSEANQWIQKMKPVQDAHLTFDFNHPSEPLTKVAGTTEDLFQLISSAREHITIISPYIRLPEHLEAELLRVMFVHNVKVKIVIPSRETTDAPFTLHAFEVQAERLQRAGVKIFIHRGPDFLHAKQVEVDGKRVYIGSHNLNYRSWRKDFESGMIITDPAFAHEVQTFDERLIANETVKYSAPPLTLTKICQDLLLGGALRIPMASDNL